MLLDLGDRSPKSGKEMFESFVQTVHTILPMNFDLDIYLEENLYIYEEISSEDFSALEWWKATTLSFCILSKMARDILFIPITMMALVSAFNTNGQIIDL